MSARQIIAAFSVVALLAGCSAASTVTPSSANSITIGAPSALRNGKAKLVVRIRIPRRHHRSHYVSPGTQGVKLAFTGPTNVTDLIAPATYSGCSSTNGALVCNITVSLVPGAYTADITTYDQPPAFGSEPSTAKVLSGASDVPLTIVLGKANSFGVTLTGVVASLAVTDLPFAFTGTPTSSAQTFAVTAYDASGNVIAGAYENPVTISNSDTSGATAVTTSGSDNPLPGQLLSSNDNASLNYNGNGAANATISASATGATTGTAVFIAATPVTLSSDLNPGSPAGTGPGSPGDLRYVMLHAAAGSKIGFNCGNPCTIVLNGPLPPIQQNLIIDGGTFGNVIIDGNGIYRVFWVDKGNVTLEHLQIQNAKALGGAGGIVPSGDMGAGGGGGAGLGGGLFVNMPLAVVTVASDYFLSNTAAGGAGGPGSATGTAGSAAGGGGLIGNGGSASGAPTQGGSGGGVLAPGTGGLFRNPGGAGGGGGGGAPGTASFFGGPGGAGSSGYAGNLGGSSGGSTGTSTSGYGGAGGFGGGGGGTGSADSGYTQVNGGAGGFGAGGGGGLPAGEGGPGGGGGGGIPGSTPAAGGALATGTGGNGDAIYDGGGGAAAGPAIFVNAGTLITIDSGASGSSAIGGASGGGGAQAGTADSTPVFNFIGTVNGSLTRGGIAGALSGSQPSVRKRRKQTASRL